MVTPIGIAIAAKKAPVQYCTVYVNDQPVRLFEVKNLTVGDCLLAAGIKMNKLYGKPGLAMIINLNGQNITIPGSHGEAPVITRNSLPSAFDEEIKSGDILTVSKGRDGLPAEVCIKDLIDEVPEKSITINGKQYTIHAAITCNEKAAPLEQILADRDKIECRIPETAEEILINLNLDNLLNDLKPFRISINEKDTFLPRHSGKLYKNGLEVNCHSLVDDGDNLQIEKRSTLTVKELAEIKQLALQESIPVIFNGKKIELTRGILEFQREGAVLSEDDVISAGDAITILQKPRSAFIFQDIFSHVNVDMPASSSGGFLLLKNGEKTSFHESIEPGDNLKIVWPAITNKQSTIKYTKN